MLKAVLELFKQTPASNQNPLTVELATAALLSEIIRADRHADERELAAYKALLREQFSLSDEAIDALADEGRIKAEDAVDLVQFTQVINQRCDQTQKRAILNGLWEVAYADKEIAPIEEHIIRRIADLLHLPHSQFIQSKLKVTET